MLAVIRGHQRSQSRRIMSNFDLYWKFANFLIKLTILMIWKYVFRANCILKPSWSEVCFNHQPKSEHYLEYLTANKNPDILLTRSYNFLSDEHQNLRENDHNKANKIYGLSTSIFGKFLFTIFCSNFSSLLENSWMRQKKWRFYSKQKMNYLKPDNTRQNVYCENSISFQQKCRL